MRALKMFLLAVIAGMVLTMTGCGQNRAENDRDKLSSVEQAESSEKKQFSVEQEESSENKRSSMKQEENTNETEKTAAVETEAEAAQNEQGEDAEDEFLFQFVVREAYEISVEGTVVTGFVYSGTMRPGDKALLLKQDGTIYDVTVKGIELYDEEAETTVSAEEAGEDTAAGVLLVGVEKDQIDNADILLGVEE